MLPYMDKNPILWLWGRACGIFAPNVTLRENDRFHFGSVAFWGFSVALIKKRHKVQWLYCGTSWRRMDCMSGSSTVESDVRLEVVLISPLRLPDSLTSFAELERLPGLCMRGESFFSSPRISWETVPSLISSHWTHSDGFHSIKI